MKLVVLVVSVVAFLAATTRAWTIPPTKRVATQPLQTTSRSSRNWQNAASRAFCGMVLTLGLVFGNPTADGLIRNVAFAGVAPLADVGLREFLVKDGNEILRLNLPTSLPTATDPSKLGDTGREVQEAVELVRLRLEQVGFSGKTPVWNAAFKEVTKAKSLIGTPDMLKGISDVKQPKAKQLVSLAQTKLGELGEAVRKQDIRSTLSLQDECSELVYNIRALSMKQGELPFEVPTEFDDLPQLKGRAIVECNLEKANEGYFQLQDGTKTNAITLTLTIDGYHAPITAGTFADLVERTFYDGMSIQSAEELIVQTGNPEGVQVDGFIDPYTKEKRVIPLELFYKKDKAPTYSYTSDDDMRSTESMAMPFQAYGALGMAHDLEDPNTASSQFWFLKWNQALVAPSRNTLDGSQACFGYVTKNQELLSQVEKGDKITRMKLVQGGENLVTNRREFSTSSNDLTQQVE